MVYIKAAEPDETTYILQQHRLTMDYSYFYISQDAHDVEDQAFELLWGTGIALPRSSVAASTWILKPAHQSRLHEGRHPLQSRRSSE